MQFKFPKKIMIGDVDFRITYNRKEGGGEFGYPWKGKRAFIKLGTRDLKTNPTRFFNVVMHELKEIIQQEQNVRYLRPDEHGDNSYEFHYTHKEHTDLCARLAGLLTHFIK